jgi:subtilase family serine protease
MSVRRFLQSILLALVVGSAYGQNSAHVLANTTPGFIKQAVDQGPLDPSTVITVTAWLELHNHSQLDALVKQQYTRGSAKFHQWLSQGDFNAAFGPTAQEVKAVQNFLSAHKLSVLAVAENNLYVKVQGTVDDVQKAFHVQIDSYTLDGITYRSNTGDPSVTDSAGGLIAAVTGMDDFGYRPMIAQAIDPDGGPFPMIPLATSPAGKFFESQCFRAPQTVNFAGGGNTATYTGNRYGADITNTALGHLPPCGYQPSEVQTAYNMTPLYSAGLDGTGQTIVITDAYGSATLQQDAELFSLLYGLPDLTPANFQVMRAPGVTNNPHGVNRNWEIETTLDVEWAHAMAPGANIVVVLGPTDHNDLDEAVNWAVLHHLGNTISNSWSTPEGAGAGAHIVAMERILQMAAAQGVDVNFASGDSGDSFTIPVTNIHGKIHKVLQFSGVVFPTSSPFATGVGGTSLALNPDNSIRFQTGWGTNITRIADKESLGSPPLVPPLSFGNQGGAGGGASVLFGKPAFQANLPGSTRLVPDIAMLADPFTGVELIETVNGQLSVFAIGGTSLATPMFSALMAIAAQKAGHGLGQAAQLVYDLPAGAVDDIIPVGSATNVTGTINGTPVTADELAAPLGNTTTYYSALYQGAVSTRWFVITFGTDTSLTTAPGWDNVTGVGAPNGANFVDAIAP